MRRQNSGRERGGEEGVKSPKQSGPSSYSDGREREMDERESGHVCMQVIIHQNPKRPLHTIKERSKALCTDWTAYRALQVNRQIIPTACTTQSTLLVKPKKGTNLSRGQRLKDTKEWKFSVEGGESVKFP